MSHAERAKKLLGHYLTQIASGAGEEAETLIDEIIAAAADEIERRADRRVTLNTLSPEEYAVRCGYGGSQRAIGNHTGTMECPVCIAALGMFRPPSEPAGGWYQTFTGKKVHVLWPASADAANLIEDIAHALSNLCRFNGHTKAFYSVAQHSVLVSRLLEMKYPQDEPRTWMIGLLHDATEAYVGDMTRPLKHAPEMSGYRDVEERWAERIAELTGFDIAHLPPCVKEADNLALALERRDLLAHGPGHLLWMKSENALSSAVNRPLTSGTIEPLPPIEAEHQFHERYRYLLACLELTKPPQTRYDG